MTALLCVFFFLSVSESCFLFCVFINHFPIHQYYLVLRFRVRVKVRNMVRVRIRVRVWVKVRVRVQVRPKWKTSRNNTILWNIFKILSRHGCISINRQFTSKMENKFAGKDACSLTHSGAWIRYMESNVLFYYVTFWSCGCDTDHKLMHQTTQQVNKHWHGRKGREKKTNTVTSAR
jgi:hypothetical protein